MMVPVIVVVSVIAADMSADADGTNMHARADQVGIGRRCAQKR